MLKDFSDELYEIIEKYNEYKSKEGEECENE